jgi:hypothetical protein
VSRVGGRGGSDGGGEDGNGSGNGTGRERASSDDRGQLVLLAAAVVAVALVPLLFAYLQLGYHADVAATTDHDRAGSDAVRALDGAVGDAERPVRGEYDWASRGDAVETVVRRLNATTTRIERARLDRGVVVRVDRNRSTASRWAATNCPSGSNRAFGPCEADRGVVVQKRAGEATVLAVAFDVTVTSDRSTTRLTVAVEVVE